ncbi:MAG: tetratricopeptide repeat protein [Alphaproteobacteria bacterium]|nr:tetratricopeptide repeat protein [Alphaproteobacteria bacterium]
MKKLVITTALLLSIGTPALAQDYSAPVNAQSVAQKQDPVMEQIQYMQKEWARIKYQIVDKDTQLDAIHKLEEHAAQVTAAYSDRPEPKIWEGIILSTDAGIVKGMSALGKVKKAKELFEGSLKQNPVAMEGSAHTSLGSLYYQVPGWPVAFGDNEEAEKHLKQALQLNPNGIDPNFFYGDFLLKDGRTDEAKMYLNRALQAPDRPDRPLADAGRRQEIKAALAQIDQKMKDGGKSSYN